MNSSNDKDSNRAGLASQASALALTTCSLADLAAAVRRAVVAIERLRGDGVSFVSFWPWASGCYAISQRPPHSADAGDGVSFVSFWPCALGRGCEGCEGRCLFCLVLAVRVGTLCDLAEAAAQRRHAGDGVSFWGFARP